MLSVFVVLVVFFGLTVFLLDMLFRRAAERSLRELMDAQMVALIAAADPDGPESVMLTAVLEARFDTPGSGLYAEIRSASGERTAAWYPEPVPISRTLSPALISSFSD